MSSVHVLIIEDEEAQIQSYEDVIGQYNKKNPLQITYAISRTFSEGQQELKSPYFDAAIIDLKLSSTSDNIEGRELVESVYQKLRIPVIIYSGSIAQIDDIQENALLKKRLRTQRFSDILQEIIEIYNTGITRFLRPFGSLDNKLTHIFWNHLSKDLDRWKKQNNPDTLLRYILSHFQEYLEISSTGDFDEYSYSEIYIKPPIKKNFHTGDLVDYKGSMYLILTPACDIVFNYKKDEKGNPVPSRKADTMLLANVKNFDYKTWCVNNKGELNKSKVSEFVKNANYRYHYLPPYLNDNGYIIDFQSLLSLGFDENVNRIATISSPFLKDVISRFGNYYSRQGQPTFRQDAIIDELMAR